jgi:hypothetical protein
MTNTLKLAALGLSVMVMAGCAAKGGEMEGNMMHEDMEARSMSQEAMSTAQQAQMTADQALQMAQENRQAMDRMFQSSMQK